MIANQQLNGNYAEIIHKYTKADATTQYYNGSDKYHKYTNSSISSIWRGGNNSGG